MLWDLTNVPSLQWQLFHLSYSLAYLVIMVGPLVYFLVISYLLCILLTAHIWSNAGVV